GHLCLRQVDLDCDGALHSGAGPGASPELLALKVEKEDGASAASAAAAWSASMYSACLGVRGSHLAAKNATTGTWAAMRSCQIWAAAPSSDSRTTPYLATYTSTVARAARDMTRGRKALGRRTM